MNDEVEFAKLLMVAGPPPQCVITPKLATAYWIGIWAVARLASRGDIALPSSQISRWVDATATAIDALHPDKKEVWKEVLFLQFLIFTGRLEDDRVQSASSC